MKAKVIIVLAAAALAVILAVGFGLKTIDRFSKLEGQYQEVLRIANAHAEILNQTIADKDKVIGEQDKRLVISSRVISKLTGSIGQKNADLLNLEKSLNQATTDAERVPILTSMVETWRAKYAQLEKVVTEKDTIVSAWVTKFNAQVAISESWKSRYEDEARLHAISRSQISALNTRLKTARITGNLKTGLVVLAGGYLAYRTIKGNS